MNALKYFLNGFTDANITKDMPDFLQYVKKECNQFDIYDLLSEYKAKKYGNDKEGTYIVTFRIENVLNYKKVLITFQYGIYKSNRHLNCTVVNLFK